MPLLLGKACWSSLVLAVALVGPNASRGQDPAGSVAASPIETGARVVLRSSETVVRVGDRLVDTKGVHRVFEVEEIRGDQLRVVADDVRGWVDAAAVLTLDRAESSLTEAIARDPEAVWAYKMRALIRSDRRDDDRALEDLAAAVRLDPKDGSSYANRALIWTARGDLDRAIADANQAARLAPRDPLAYQTRGNARLAKKQYALAIADYNHAIRLDPDDPAKYRSRALAWLAEGEYERAIDDYRAALRLRNDDAMASNGLAWIRATCPDARLRDARAAVEAATRACELTRWSSPYCLGTLAAASAEQGDFQAAVQWQSKAIALFPRDDGNQEEYRRRLALYQQRKPYHEPPRPE